MHPPERGMTGPMAVPTFVPMRHLLDLDRIQVGILHGRSAA
jgi:hypothetical protein